MSGSPVSHLLFNNLAFFFFILVLFPGSREAPGNTQTLVPSGHKLGGKYYITNEILKNACVGKKNAAVPRGGGSIRKSCQEE